MYPVLLFLCYFPPLSLCFPFPCSLALFLCLFPLLSCCFSAVVPVILSSKLLFLCPSFYFNSASLVFFSCPLLICLVPRFIVLLSPCSPCSSAVFYFTLPRFPFCYFISPVFLFPLVSLSFCPLSPPCSVSLFFSSFPIVSVPLSLCSFNSVMFLCPSAFFCSAFFFCPFVHCFSLFLIPSVLLLFLLFFLPLLPCLVPLPIVVLLPVSLVLMLFFSFSLY